MHLQPHTLLLHTWTKQQLHHKLERILKLWGGGELDEQARSRTWTWTRTWTRTRGGGEGKKRKSNSSLSKKRKKKKKTNKTPLSSLSTEHSNDETTNANHDQDHDHDLDLATIKAILLPRKFSIPHLIDSSKLFIILSYMSIKLINQIWHRQKTEINGTVMYQQITRLKILIGVMGMMVRKTTIWGAGSTSREVYTKLVSWKKNGGSNERI